MATDLLVDGHVHVASPDESRYPRQLTGVGSKWWRAGGDVDELASALDAAAVSRAVVVQAVGVYGYDCRYAADVAASSDGRYAFVGAVDMAADPVIELARLVETTPLVGLRLFGVGAADADWLVNGRGRDIWDAAAEIGCVLVPTIFADGLPALRSLIEHRPDTIVALDHCGFPDLGGPGAMAALLALADLPALHLKVTSHNLDDDGDPCRFLEPLVAAFGPDRVCWGSDHPQHSSLTYGGMVALARRASRHLEASDRASFLGGNSLRLWWPST